MSKTKTTKEFIIEMTNKNPNIGVLGEYKNAHTGIHCYCRICGFDRYQDGKLWCPTPNHLLQGEGCPNCTGKVVVRGQTDLWTVRPDVAKMLKNPEDGYIYRAHSNQKLDFVCPYCHKVLSKILNDVTNDGLHCKWCDDGISYPNKLMRNILQYLNIDFIPEYSPEWIGNKRYDFYLKINNQEYIIEMDGGIGHGKIVMDGSEATRIKSMEYDDYKDKMAIQHGIHVIRIDCYLSELDYIKGNIIINLSNIINVDLIDWNYCDLQSQKSIMIDVCKYYADTLCSFNELAIIFKLHKDTIRSYLRKGYKLNLCPEYKKHPANSRRVLCLTSNIIFDSAHDAGVFYDIDVSSILKCAKGILGQVHGLKFCLVDSYVGNIEDLTSNYSIKDSTKIIHNKMIKEE